MTAPAQVRLADASPPLAGVRKTLGDLAMISGSEGLLRAANFALAIVIARRYSAADLGIYAAALAVSTCAVTAADGGLQLTAIHGISAEPQRANQVFSGLLEAKLLLVPLAALIAFSARMLGSGMPIAGAVFALVFARTLLQSFAQLNFAVLKALGRVPPITVLQSIHFTLMAAVLLAATMRRPSFAVLLVLLVASQMVETAGSAFSVRRGRVRFSPVAWRTCVAVIRKSIPAGVTATLATVAMRSDLVLLSMFAGAAEVGQFAAAQFPMIAMYLGSWLFGSLVLSQFTLLRYDTAALQAATNRWARTLVAVLAPATVAMVWLAPVAVRTLFGAGYEESARLAAVLLLATPCIWLNSLYLHRAVALEDRRIHVRAYALVMAIAAIATSIMAHEWGAMGVAVAVVMREGGLLSVLATLSGEQA